MNLKKLKKSKWCSEFGLNTVSMVALNDKCRNEELHVLENCFESYIRNLTWSHEYIIVYNLKTVNQHTL